jgi:sulfotransferase
VKYITIPSTTIDEERFHWIPNADWDASVQRKTYFFLSGLPRSGTTLLGAILEQNPDIYVGPTSPVLDFLISFDNVFNPNRNLFQAFPKEDFRVRTLSRIPDDWYSDVDSPIIIDKNRGWPRAIPYAKLFTDNIKIICTVRSVLEILSSWILLNRKSPNSFIDKGLKKLNLTLTDDNRCEYLMQEESGDVEQALYSLKSGFTDHSNFLHLIEYDDLINDTENTINRIYNFLKLPIYKHKYDNIGHINQENDMVHGMPEMHNVKSTISRSENNPLDILSDNIIKKYSGLEFWR